MSEGTERQRRISDIVRFKPFDGIDGAKVAGLAAIGLFAGGMIGMVMQLAKVDIRTGVILDPPTPNMEELEPDLVSVYQKFMGAFYNLCPKEHKSKYQAEVKRSIKNAEAVMLIEAQLFGGEIERNTSHRNQANVHADIAMKCLRKLRDFFDPSLITTVSDAADVVFVHLANHTGNIRVLTSIK